MIVEKEWIDFVSLIFDRLLDDARNYYYEMAERYCTHYADVCSDIDVFPSSSRDILLAHFAMKFYERELLSSFDNLDEDTREYYLNAQKETNSKAYVDLFPLFAARAYVWDNYDTCEVGKIVSLQSVTVNEDSEDWESDSSYTDMHIEYFENWGKNESVNDTSKYLERLEWRKRLCDTPVLSNKRFQGCVDGDGVGFVICDYMYVKKNLPHRQDIMKTLENIALEKSPGAVSSFLWNVTE